MRADPLGDKLSRGMTALGLYANEPDMIELSAHLGFDWFMLDQMFSSNDWSKTEMLLRTGEAAGITPVVRVQSNPWFGEDPHIYTDIARNLGLGARYVFISNTGKAQIERAMPLAEEWHRKVLIVHPFADHEGQDWTPKIEAMARDTYLIPQPECMAALNELLDTLTVPGVRIVFIGMGDASREFAEGGKPDWYNPRLWQLIDDAVRVGRERGVVIGANTGPSSDLSELASRAKRLHEHGVRMIMLQGATYLFQVAVGRFLRDVKDLIGEPALGETR